HGAVEMGADVQRSVDALRHDHLSLEVLGVVHLVARIANPAGGVDVHHMGHVDDFHSSGFLAIAARSCSPDGAQRHPGWEVPSARLFPHFAPLNAGYGLAPA